MKKFLLSVMIALLLFTTGCEKQPTPPEVEPSDKPKTEVTTPEPKPEKKAETPPVVEKPTPENKVHSMEVTVYYPDQAGMSLVGVKRKIEVTNDNQKYLEALNCLLSAPSEEDLTKIFPKGASIRNVTLKGDTAVVDLDGGITKNFVGGSTGEEFLINSVVDTLTEFDEVKRVRILIDGAEVETLAGHMDLSQPLKRDE